MSHKAFSPAFISPLMSPTQAPSSHVHHPRCSSRPNRRRRSRRGGRGNTSRKAAEDPRTARTPPQPGLKRPPRKNDARVKPIRERAKGRQPEIRGKRDEAARARRSRRGRRWRRNSKTERRLPGKRSSGRKPAAMSPRRRRSSRHRTRRARFSVSTANTRFIPVREDGKKKNLPRFQVER